MCLRIKVLSIILTVVMLVACLFFNVDRDSSVYAGSSIVTVATKDDIKNSEFTSNNFVTDEITLQGSKAIFNTNNTDKKNARMITYTKVLNYKEKKVDVLFDFSAKIDIQSLKNDGYFSVCFGIESVRTTEIGSSNLIDIRFENNGVNKIALSCNQYKDSNITTIVNKTTLNKLAFNSEFVLEIHAKTDGTFSVTFLTTESGDTIYEYEKLNYKGDGKGFIGFFSKNQAKATLSEIEITSRSYLSANNVDFVETFSHDNIDCYNKNLISTSSVAGAFSPSGSYVENGQFVVKNATHLKIDSMYEYSNFELEMDITYFQRRAEFTEGFDKTGKENSEISNNVVTPISSWIGIAFGMSSKSMSIDYTAKNSKTLLIEGCPYGTDYQRWEEYSNPRYIMYNGDGSYNTLKVQSMKQDANGNSTDKYLYNSKYDNNEKMTLKLSVYDGEITLYIKLNGGEYGEPVFYYNMGTSYMGYIRVFGCASQNIASKGNGYTMAENLCIDNFSIRNTDANSIPANTPAFVSNIREKTKDFVYTTKPDNSDLSYIFK